MSELIEVDSVELAEVLASIAASQGADIDSQSPEAA
jgi:hypothetical protein